MKSSTINVIKLSQLDQLGEVNLNFEMSNNLKANNSMFSAFSMLQLIPLVQMSNVKCQKQTLHLNQFNLTNNLVGFRRRTCV